MTNRFVSATGKELPAADRVFTTMIDMAVWGAQSSGIVAINQPHAEMLIKIHMRAVQAQCYSNGHLRRW